MKLISEHLGQIIAALTAIAILITSVVFFKAPIGDFFGNIVTKETSIVDSVTQNTDDVDVANLNPYAAKVNTVQKLYDVGEQNLTDADVVQVNGVDCYVLRVQDNKALMITKYIYRQKFNNTYSKGYDYSTSDLKAYMDDFYTNQLASDPYIMNTTVTYYTNTEWDSGNFDNYQSGTLTQKVFSLDAKEAKANASKFKWTPYEYAHAFWVTAGCSINGNYCAAGIYYTSVLTTGSVMNSAGFNARPCFWLSLD